MTRPIIEVENLSKRYRLGQFNAQTMREEAEQFIQRLRGKAEALSADGSEFWALKDVSFTVQPGEVVGIIGRNGAGKSTLLKILSRVTEPTCGEIRIRGRVASLLEVGTGFHPELTGRENIYLNGAILGMTKREIAAKFDAIVAFAEIEKFLDTPVKRYSSGMYVRLAFAVAAHLEPEILIVDEVLAVGDAEFQKRCLKKMGDVAKGGRTVLFVSHNMRAIASLCDGAILIEHGRIAMSGRSTDVVQHYLGQAAGSAIAAHDQIWLDLSTAPGNARIRLRRIRALAERANSVQDIDINTPVSIEIEYWNLKPDSKAALNLQIYGIDGAEVFEDWSAEKDPVDNLPLKAGLYKTTCRIPAMLLNEGAFQIRIIFFDIDSVRIIYESSETIVFTVHDVTGRPVNWHGRFIGPVHPALEWRTQLMESM